MISRIVRFHSAAWGELQHEVTRYDAQVPGLGDEFANEVKRATHLLQVHPDLGTPRMEGAREFVLRRFPFSLVYRVRETELVVIAVAHQRRRPSYWRRRT